MKTWAQKERRAMIEDPTHANHTARRGSCSLVVAIDDNTINTTTIHSFIHTFISCSTITTARTLVRNTMLRSQFSDERHAALQSQKESTYTSNMNIITLQLCRRSNHCILYIKMKTPRESNNNASTGSYQHQALRGALSCRSWT